MTDAVELTNFFIDVVKPIEVDELVQENPGEEFEPAKAQVSLHRYSVLAPNAEEALRRYLEEDAGVLSEATDPTDIIIVGLQAASNPLGL